MTVASVLAVLDALAGADVDAVVDGGWGVDALLRRQTRKHSDVDLVIAVEDLKRVEQALLALSFHRVPSTPDVPARAVLDAVDGSRADFHLVRYDDEGNGWQELAGEVAGTSGWCFYPADHLDAEGEIDGRKVTCISAWLQLNHHVGFAWKERDLADMRGLHDAFCIPLPPQIPHRAPVG